MRVVALCLPLFLPCLVGCQSTTSGEVRFHTETSAASGPKLSFPAETPVGQRFFSSQAAITPRHYSWFQPFREAGMPTQGAVFKLNNFGELILRDITTQANGTFLLPTVNEVPKEAVFIDGRVDDGIVVVWSGLTEKEIKSIGKSVVMKPAASLPAPAGLPSGGAALPSLAEPGLAPAAGGPFPGPTASPSVFEGRTIDRRPLFSR
ncbi:MAG: hypothetical protein AAF555_07660 [Verrucomicrobiota bacterium]